MMMLPALRPSLRSRVSLSHSGYRPATTIRFIGFAAEEPGLVGSTRYADAVKAAGRNVILMINFDMIGYTTNADPDRHFNIIEYPPDTETSSLVAAAARSYTSLKPLTTTVDHGNVDSFPFAVAGYPAVTCTEYLDNPYYHKPLDRPEHAGQFLRQGHYASGTCFNSPC